MVMVMVKEEEGAKGEQAEPLRRKSDALQRSLLKDSQKHG